MRNNPYEHRWRWWYTAIADWMIRNPGGTLGDCAKELDRHYTTICMIACTDMFKRYLEERKTQWREQHDFQLAGKLHEVANKGLDLMLDNMKRKGDQIPMQRLESITTTALTNLGYGQKPATPAVVVNNTLDARSQTMIAAPVSPAALEEARDALRAAERKRALDAPTFEMLPPVSGSDNALVGSAGTEAEFDTLLSEDEGEDSSAPLTLSAQ